MQFLYDYVDSLGVTVEFAPLAGRNGEYRDDLQRIRLRENMSHRLTRWTLAHELGHAVHGHRPNMFGQTDARQERQADEWAAMALINLEQYREVEHLRDGHLPSMAHDLDVVTKGVEAYQQILARIGDNVYLKPGLGASAIRLTA